MVIQRHVSDLLASNMYLLIEDGHAVVIDPFRDVSFAEGLVIDRILLTHEHYDHISGVNLWKEETGAHVLCSAPCAENIQNARKNLARLFDVFCELQTWIRLDEIPPSDQNYTCKADETFSDTTSFEWQGHRFELFEMPGHSAGSIGILVDRECFFSGDSLMENSEIELRLPGGSRKAWEQTGRERLMSVPESVTVYPGHFSEFRLRKEKE